MVKEINLNMKSENIVQVFKDHNVDDTINFKTSKGYIYVAGDILCKLEGTNHFIEVNHRWVLV